ncbi:IucA/IucC family protein [Aliamphritea spongicola]|nr:IucA/IucC family protein [Aliamphritea spongicola]
MNAPVMSVPVTDPAFSQAGLNGLFRLLRCVLREELFDWQPHEQGLCMEGPAGKLVLQQPEYDCLDGLLRYSELLWQSETLQKPVCEPAEALQKMLEISGYVPQPQDDPWQRIIDELINSQQNEALTIAWQAQQNDAIRAECLASNLNSLLAWSRFAAAVEYREVGNSSILIEQWAAAGHPYHPGSKTKLGFSEQEVLRYAPEFGNDVPLTLIAIHQSLLKVSSLCPDLNYRAWFRRHYPDWYGEWLLQFEASDADNYLPVPVHPWQLKHRLPELFADEIRNGLIRLNGPEFSALATLSCRTLAPGLDCDQPYIKLPVAAQMTSSMRNLSSSSVDNAPRIGAILQDILLHRPDIAGALRFQWDDLGLHTCVDTAERDHDRYLSVIFRRNPATVLRHDEHGVVIAALFQTSPITGFPLYLELMQQAGVNNYRQAVEWFSKYISTLFTAVIDLYLEYGLALEAHQQNMLAIFTEAGELRGFIHRDVGGICLYTEALAKQGWPVNFTDSAVLVDSYDAARKTFLTR